MLVKPVFNPNLHVKRVQVSEHLMALILPVYVKMDITTMDRIKHAYVNEIFIQLFIYIY